MVRQLRVVRSNWLMHRALSTDLTTGKWQLATDN
jgi:hypothetical protein